MKIKDYKTQVTTKDTLSGLLSHALDAFMVILVSVIILGLLMIGSDIAQKRCLKTTTQINLCR